jgi:hypothetical protein
MGGDKTKREVRREKWNKDMERKEKKWKKIDRKKEIRRQNCVLVRFLYI